MYSGYGTPRYVINERIPDGCTVTLAGHMATDWAANLCTALAERKIDVRRGHAVRDADGYWMARFDLYQCGSVDPRRLDFVRLTEQRASYETPSVRLHHFDFVEVDEHAGSIRLDLVEQPDSVGLLAALFRWLGSLGLVPVEFRLETVNGLVHDTFWLKALSETRPRDEVCLALGRRLADFVAA